MSNLTRKELIELKSKVKQIHDKVRIIIVNLEKKYLTKDNSRMIMITITTDHNKYITNEFKMDINILHNLATSKEEDDICIFCDMSMKNEFTSIDDSILCIDPYTVVKSYCRCSFTIKCEVSGKYFRELTPQFVSNLMYYIHLTLVSQ